jgi:hypothetical protein
VALREKLVQNRQLGEGYNEEMEQLHNRNAEMLNVIIDAIGYPTIESVGDEASEAAWLIIQHSIARPAFMKKCATLLRIAVNEDKANIKNLAYLTDRIAVWEEKMQKYGTQFDWDENGELSAHRIDDLAMVNQRRKSIGLNTLEEQTIIIRRRAEMENQRPPENLKKRQSQIAEWRRKTGWV